MLVEWNKIFLTNAIASSPKIEMQQTIDYTTIVVPSKIEVPKDVTNLKLWNHKDLDTELVWLYDLLVHSNICQQKQCIQKGTH